MAAELGKFHDEGERIGHFLPPRVQEEVAVDLDLQRRQGAEHHVLGLRGQVPERL